MNNTDPNTERIEPLNPSVVSLVGQWLEDKGENCWFHEAREHFPNVDVFTLGTALVGYRRRHRLVHPGKLRRQHLRRKFNVSFDAVERGAAPMTVKLKAEISRRRAEETMEAA